MDMTMVDRNMTEEDDRERLLRLLDRGIDDMEAGRVLSAEEAYEMVTKLRNARRNERA